MIAAGLFLAFALVGQRAWKARITQDLWRATFHREPREMERLLALGGDPNVPGPNGASATANILESVATIHVKRYNSLLQPLSLEESRTIEDRESACAALIIESLLAHPPTATASARALFAAAELGDDRLVRRALDSGVDVNARTGNEQSDPRAGRYDRGQWTALMFAASHGNASTARLLLDSGADANAHGIARYGGVGGQTALRLAVESGSIDTVQLLLNRGADPNAQGEGGGTPLMGAITVPNSTRIALRLLKAGADPNASTPAGITPLQMAVEYGPVSTVRLLLAHNARLDAGSSSGPAILDVASRSACYARSHNRIEVVQVLVDRGADRLDQDGKSAADRLAMWVQIQRHPHLPSASIVRQKTAAVSAIFPYRFRLDDVSVSRVMTLLRARPPLPRIPGKASTVAFQAAGRRTGLRRSAFKASPL